jgi:hypothetical protein
VRERVIKKRQREGPDLHVVERERLSHLVSWSVISVWGMNKCVYVLNFSSVPLSVTRISISLLAIQFIPETAQESEREQEPKGALNNGGV